ncbi:MAG: hypothetical protein R2882_01585 [Gemmatimonadales bacterium]
MASDEISEPQRLADELHDAIHRAMDDRVEELLAAGADPRPPYRRTGDDAVTLAKMYDVDRPGRWRRMIEMLEEARLRLNRE